MKTYTGGCHCGNVKYEVDADIDSVMECNCSHCSKKGFLLKFVPASAFRLTQGDEASLTEYKFNKKHISHLFCPVCGVQSYGRGKGQDGVEMIAINARCLDGMELDSLEIKKIDGKNF